MYETFQSFDEYIRDYDQQRAEGLLLRYLTEVYKVLMQTVPESYRSEEVEAIIDYFGTMIRNIDSSLLDEWERMRNPNYVSRSDAAEAEAVADNVDAPDITRDMRSFTVLIRNEVFRFLRALAARDYEAAFALLDMSQVEDDQAAQWSSAKLDAAMVTYYQERDRLLTDRQARHPQLCRVTPRADGQGWKVEQTLTDPHDHNDWGIKFEINKLRTLALGRPVLTLMDIGEMS